MKHRALVLCIPLLLSMFSSACLGGCWELTDWQGKTVQTSEVWHVKSRISGNAALVGYVGGEHGIIPTREISAVHFGEPRSGSRLSTGGETASGEILFSDGSRKNYESDQELFFLLEDVKDSMPLTGVRSIIRCASEPDTKHTASATDTATAPAAAEPPTATADSVLLRNGDQLSGRVTTGTFEWQAPYATLSFSREHIRSITLPGASGESGLIELRNGDRISGALLNATLDVTLHYGQQIPLDRKMLKTIHFAPAAR